MPKGPLVTHNVEALIGAIHKEHPKWKAKQIQKEVHLLVKKQDPSTPPKWPGLSAVQKVLATVRKRENEPDPQEKPWCLSVQDSDPEHSIPNDAIPAVLKVWARRAEKGWPFSIREAKWAARLWEVIPATPKLSRMASIYAIADQIYEYNGRPFNSRHLDRKLMGLPGITPSVDELIETASARMFKGTTIEETEGHTQETEEGGKA